MNPLALQILSNLSPHVHEYDAAEVLGDALALVKKYTVRKQYHEEMIAAEVDVLNGKIPRLNRKPEEGPARPWSESSVRNFTAHVVHLCAKYYDYEPGQCAVGSMCEDAVRDFNDKQWYLDTAKCIKVAYQNQKGKKASTRTAIERILAVGQLCDMHHTVASIEAAKIYRRHAFSVKQHHDAATPVQDPVKKRKIDDEQEENQVVEENSDASSDAASDVPELAEVRRALRAEYDKIVQLHGRSMESFMRAARNWLLFAAWLGVGELYEDTLVPMRTDLEIARFDEELKIGEGELWFETPRAVGCTKTNRAIKWNISKHSPMVADILIKMREKSLELHGGYIWPKAGECTAPRTSSQICNTRKDLASQGRAYGLPVGYHTIQKMRHLSKRCMPPRTPDEANDMAYRRGSSVEAMMQYGSFTTKSTSMQVE